MIDRQGGDVVIHCDACPEHLDTEEKNFGDAIQEMKRATWKALQVKGEWMHFCPECYKKL